MSRSSPAVIAGCCLLGAASGLRSQMGMAGVVLRGPRSAKPAWLQGKAARRVVVALALGELVADKLPSTPNRTEPAGLAARIGLSALSCGILASSAGQGGPVPIIVGAATAVGAAYAGMTARAALARHVPPIVAALAEDALAVTLSAAAWPAASAALVQT